MVPVVPAHFEGRVVTSESVQHLDETPETEVEVGEIKGSKKLGNHHLIHL